MREVVLLFLTSDIILYPLTSLPLHYIEGPVAVRSERGFHSHAVFVLVFFSSAALFTPRKPVEREM